MAVCCVLVAVEARSKYVTAEEDNPYEFGFTIDGQQHRHEKKGTLKFKHIFFAPVDVLAKNNVLINEELVVCHLVTAVLPCL